MENEILALPMECWRWVPEFEGLYEVSTRGRVRSVDRWVTYPDGRKQFIKGKILKPTRCKFGYLYVDLCRDGKKHRFKVHRLVLEVWGDGNPEKKPQVNHLDENKTNNDVYNLSWVTAKENNTWGTARKRMAASRLNGSQSTPVQALDPETGVVVLEFPSMREAGRKGFNRGCIWSCCHGESRQYKGYIWRQKP